MREDVEGGRPAALSADGSTEGVPLHPKSGVHGAHGHSSDRSAEVQPMRYLYFGAHDGAAKLQVVLTTVLLLSCTYISVLFCLLLTPLNDIHPVMVSVAIVPIFPQLGLFFLTMRNFAHCANLEFEINHSLKKKISRNCKLRKTIRQLHRLVQLKDLAMHAVATSEKPKTAKITLEKIDPSDRRHMHDLFVLVDADLSGQITADEMRQALSTLGHDLGDKTISTLVGLMDDDKSGEIGFSEFACVLHDLKSGGADEVELGSEAFIEKLFGIFDDDGMGSITFDEVAKVLSKFGSWDMTEVAQLFREMDTDGSGEVGMHEFSEFVHDILEG